MKTKKPLTKVNCGDWHETWGMGTNKIGKLSIEIITDCPINFVWKGHSQGRHGQVWNRGANARLMLVNGELEITKQKGDIPRIEIIKNAVNILLRENNLPEITL